MSFTKIRTGNILSGSVASGSLGNAAITGFPASSAADDSDLLLIYDDSEEGLRKQSRSNFLGTIEPVEIPTASIAFGQIDGAGVDGDTSLQYLTGSGGFSGGLFYGDMSNLQDGAGVKSRPNAKDGVVPGVGSGSVAFNVARIYLTSSAQMALKTGGALVLSSSVDAARAVQIGASGGTSATVHITSKGSGGSAIDIDTDGGLDIDVGSTVSIDAGGALSIDAVGASNVTSKGALTVSGSTGLNLKSDGGTIDMETRVGAIDIDAASTIDIDGAGGINIGKAADVAIDIDADTLDIDASGAVTIDSTSTFSIDGVGASNVTTRGALTVSGSSTLDLRADSGDITVETRQGSIYANGASILLMSGGAGLSPRGHGDDTNLYVSGAIGSRGTAVRGTAVYGGDLLVSGAIHSILGMSGSLTRLTDGKSYIAAGAGISITSSSNGQVVITNDGTVGDITSVTAGTGLSGGGSTGDVTLAVNDSIVATISGSNFAGNVGVTGSLGATLGFSGSLTRLLSGKSYIAAGAGISIASSSNGQIVITNDGTVGDITSVTAGTGLSGGGGSGDVTLAIDDSIVATISGSNFAGNVGVTGSIRSTLGFSGSLTRLTDGKSYLAAGAGISIASASNGQIVITNDGTVGDITSVSAGTGLTGGGTNGDVTLAINDSVVATISGSNFAGNVGVTGSLGATLGFSGSLTRLVDGTSYLAAGSNVTITSASNGQVLIASTDTNTEYTAGTGLKLSGLNQFSINDSVVATISGSNFSGNVGVTGSIRSTLGYSGSLTNLLDGTSYLAAGSNITIASASNGQITIAAGGGDPGGSDTQVQFNDGGSFGGDAGLLYNKTSNSLYAAGVISGALGFSGSLTRLIDGTSYLAAGAGISITSSSNGQVLITNDGTVGDITSVTAGTGLSGGGSSGGVTLSIDDSVVATISGSNFAGNVGVTGSLGATLGFSGSLTRLLNGKSYLAAGSNVTITSASNGQVLIAATDNNTEYTAGTGLILDSTEFSINDSIVATISGSNFAGNVGVTGSIRSTLGYSGSLTRLLDGTSYLAAGSNVTITSASNGQVLIAATDNNTEYSAGTGLILDGTTFTINDSLVATISGSNFAGNVGVTGSVRSTLGYSGSLTRLLDGTSYLAAGSNVTITSASNGQVLIAAATGITELSDDTSPELGGQLVTADHKIAFGTGDNTSEIDFTYNAGGNFTAIASVKSIDMFLDLNGGDSGQKFRIFNNLQPTSAHAAGTNTDTNAIFMVREEGNVFTKGYITSSMGFSGSLTRLADGTSYLAAGSNVTITSASNGQVLIAATDNNTEYTAGTGLILDGTAFTINDSLVATISGSNFAGNVGVTGSFAATLGMSGSLTRLIDGKSYLVAGSNVTIASASNGQVTISSAGGGTPAGSNTELQFNDDGSFGGISGATTDGSAVTFGDSGILVGQDITHAGDADTKITFGDDAIGFTAGGEQLLTISEAGTDMVTVGDGGDVDFRVRTNNDDNTLYVVGSTDRVGIGLNGPATTLHLKDSDVTIRLQRDDNSEAGTIEFAGAAGALGASIAHDVVGNDLVFDVFDGSALEESLRLGGYGSGTNRQVIILSGNTMHAGAMQPRQAADIAFFVSGAVGSRGTGVKGAAVFGGDLYVSGAAFVELGLSGSLTRLTDGRSYLAAGSNVTITSASNGQVTIAAASGGGSTSPGGSDTQLQFNDGGSFGGNSGLIFNKTSGLLTVAKGAVFNEGSNDADFRVESNGNENMLFVDGGNNKVGIGTAAPLTTLHISGSAATEAALTIQGQADVGIRLAADKANGDEGNNPYIDFYQDGQNPSSRNNRLANIAMEGDAGTSFSDSIANAFFIDTFCPNSTNAARQFQIATDTTKNGHNARLTIGGVRGNVGLHTAAPAEALHLSGAIRIDSQGRENLLIISGTAGTAATNSHQVFFLSGGAGASPRGHGDDTAFFVSGSVGSVGGSVKGTAVFGGDMVVSGALHPVLGMSGSLTRLIDGTSYLAAGSNVTITSASNGQVLIAASDNNTEYTAGTGLILDSTEFSINDSLVATISGSNFAGNVGITGSLQVTSEVRVAEYIRHLGDSDTHIRFQANNLNLVSGGKSFIKLDSSTNKIQLNNGNEDLDVQVTDDNGDVTFHTDGGKNSVAIRHEVPLEALHISGGVRVDSEGRENLLLISGTAGTAATNSHQVFFLSGGAGTSPRGHGDDTAFFVSGSVDSRGTSVKGTAVFGGDMAISGTLAVNLSDAAVGSQFVVTTDGKVGIGTSTPSVKLSVGGNMEVGEYIYHKNDADTFIRYQADDIEIEVGGKPMIKMSEGSLDQVLILSGGAKESADPKNFADTNFFVSGSAGSRGTSTIGTAVFGGDLVISGALQVQSATNFKPQLVDLGSGASGTITATSPLIFLDCDSIGAGGGGFFAATIATSGFSDGDTVRIVVTTDVNENLLFTSGILADASKVFGIPAANAKGASFQLVYVASASAWAVLSHNGLATF
jgi:DNA-binding transcriptional regulator YdaS (Cro superfamily)